jgi:hypothetical protein
MQIDFSDLPRRVALGLDAYRVLPHPESALGSALPPEWYAERLVAMRSALVQPTPAKIRDVDPATGGIVVLDVMIVVDDGEGGMVAFHPLANEFVLVVRDTDPDRLRAVDIVSCGVRGDVVDCYLSA